MTRGGTALWIERFLWAAGFMVLGFCGMFWLNARLQQTEGNKELDHELRARQNEALQKQPQLIPDGGLVGKVEIPRLQLAAVVFQGAECDEKDNVLGFR